MNERNLQPTLMSGAKTEERKVVCPQGHEMILQVAHGLDPVGDHIDVAWYVCECGWRSPDAQARTEQEAITGAYLAATAHPRRHCRRFGGEGGRRECRLSSTRASAVCQRLSNHRARQVPGVLSAERRGVPDVDCFALDMHKRKGGCNVMGCNCLLQRGLPCAFHRTVADHAASRAMAFDRIRGLPQAQRVYITETYLMQKEGEA